MPTTPLHALALLGALFTALGAEAASVAPVATEHGMVVSAHRLATQVGVQVQKDGGNAVDAAVAMVYPAAGNLGGAPSLGGKPTGRTGLAMGY